MTSAATRRPSPVAGATLLVIGYLVALPLVLVIVLSLGGTVGRLSELSLDAYRDILASPTLAASLRSTFLFAVPATTGSVVLGVWFAWVAERSGPVSRNSIRALVLLPAVMPGILTTTAWTMILSPRIGLANSALEALGVSGPVFNAYTLPAMIWVEATDGLSLPFLLATVALRSVPPAALEAAAVAGSAPRRATRTVLLPLLAPALTAATLLVFVRTVGSFAVPATMGIPGGVRVLATEVFLLARQFPPRFGLAAAYAVIQVAVALLALEGYRRMTRRSDRYRMVLGREPERSSVVLAKRGETVLAHLALGVITVVPLLVAIGVAVAPRFGLAQIGGIADFSLSAFREVLESTIFRRAVRNTLVMGGWAAVLTTALGLLTSRVVVRGSGRVASLVDTLATAPLAMPGNVLGLALLWWYLILPDVGLYASRGAIIIAYVTAFLPFAHRSIHAALLALDPSASEASAASGAGRARTLRRIILPMVAPGLIVGLLLVTVRAAKAIAIPALMAGPGTEVLPLLVYERFVDARYAQASAIGLLTTGLIAISLGAVLLLRRFIAGAGLSARSIATVGSA